MSSGNVHSGKRKKNLMLMALILGWCFLIFLVTMVRLAQAHDIAKSFMPARQQHESQTEDTKKQWDSEWNEKTPERAASEKSMNEERASHRSEGDKTKASWDQTWADSTPARQQDEHSRDEQRRAHRAETDANPPQWWENWDARLNP